MGKAKEENRKRLNVSRKRVGEEEMLKGRVVQKSLE